jgi:polysaccharide export outer membrane protein
MPAAPSSVAGRVRLALFACGVLLAGCAPGADLPPVPPAYAGPYLLGPGDDVRIITFGDTTLSGTFGVDETGDIAMPLLGPVKAAGLTTDALQGVVMGELRRRKLFNAPSVVIEVSTRRPVFVLGEVQKPGQYPYQPGMTVVSAVAIAGGYTYRAVKQRVEVARVTQHGQVKGQADPDAAVQAGDVITVLERHF